jgi:hypothetical protein
LCVKKKQDGQEDDRNKIRFNKAEEDAYKTRKDNIRQHNTTRATTTTPQGIHHKVSIIYPSEHKRPRTTPN